MRVGSGSLRSAGSGKGLSLLQPLPAGAARVFGTLAQSILEKVRGRISCGADAVKHTNAVGEMMMQHKTGR